MTYLTDPAAIARVLPPPLKPFSMPVVTLSVCHIHNPNFTDDYYEAVLGVYAFYGETVGLYPVGLVLGGAYSKNNLLLHKVNLVGRLNADDIAHYLLSACYDRTVFMETGRISFEIKDAT
jgi:Acetoacetate decarboxylase (ADC)